MLLTYDWLVTGIVLHVFPKPLVESGTVFHGPYSPPVTQLAVSKCRGNWPQSVPCLVQFSSKVLKEWLLLSFYKLSDVLFPKIIFSDVLYSQSGSKYSTSFLFATALAREVMQLPPSVLPLVFTIFGTKSPLTSNICMWVGHDHSSWEIESQGHGSD